MRVGVLEWASCGGSQGLERLPDSIRREGWAMCRGVLDSLRAAGHEPIACLLPEFDPWAGTVALDLGRDIRQQWAETYSPCDLTLVIAPESDQVLLQVETWCRQQGIKTGGCDLTFLTAASDKWITAQAWSRDRLPQPPTWLLADFDPLAAASSHAESMWVVKPRDGVGCDGIERMKCDGLPAAVASRRSEADKWLVQPWIAGEAYSRAALVDAQGHKHWLPIASQNLAIDHTVAYRGGTIEPDFVGADFVARTLGRAIDALGGKPRGWVGVDFLWDSRRPEHPLTVIEVNPRLTTSFVGLAAAGAPDLAGQIVSAALGEPIRLPSQWHRHAFV